MKILKKIGWLLLIVFVIAQFFGPQKNEGDLTSIKVFEADTNPPENVSVILKESCYDCHSDYTRYPWYSNITPVNYWMAEHVEDGKKHFNVSKWDAYSVKRKDHKIEELIEMVEDRSMPLESYTWAHSEAKLSDADIESVKEWAQNLRIKYSLIPKAE
ncbi:heme-binding domain-containing protein [Formosa sp. S-31]|uniref:heme-binding domain-containing protein n=1 Tax=Formosa sp. S-31 TaxID=2790949 RepID=UPI003EBF8B20